MNKVNINRKQDILFVGVGGQGTILASDIVSEVALALGYDIKKSDTLGMAQRGGSVTSHVRIGPIVYAPLVSKHEADIIMAFEKLEAARWVNYLSPNGTVIINNYALPPLSISLGMAIYPDDQSILDSYFRLTRKVFMVDGIQEAVKLGDVRILNVFMLGILSIVLPYKYDEKLWKNCISSHVPPKVIDINIRAFERGREVGSSVYI
jgi:indolepyruvate ferredoxin oxidoreductase beta subunit